MPDDRTNLILGLKMGGDGVTLMTSDGEIHVKLLTKKGGSCFRLAIKAPPNVHILRDKILRTIMSE